ncbi:MAG: response regulator transcription factor [Cytophagales bacterium]|nr:response regulator transcription factor [Cytophagales bacterium]
MSLPIRVAIADDHQLFIDGLQEVIARMEGVEVVHTAGNGAELLEGLATHPCDLAVVDIHMPVADGLQTTRLLRGRYPHTKVLILTMNNEISLIKHVLEAGALGYVLKTSGKEDLERAIRRVAAGLTFFSEAVAAELARQYMPEGASAVQFPKEDAKTPLTEREREIVALIAREYSSAEIANLLFISPATVDTHRKNIQHKLGVKNIVGVLKYAFRAGLMG